MLVYRLQDKYGMGPYRNNSLLLTSQMNQKHTRCKKHPTGMRDGLWALETNVYRYGFGSLRQLRKWFHGWLQDLRAAGYEVVLYDIPERYVKIGISWRQLVFDSRKAARVELE